MEHDAFVACNKTGKLALFETCETGLKCTQSNIVAFKVNEVYSGIDILETDLKNTKLLESVEYEMC